MPKRKREQRQSAQAAAVSNTKAKAQKIDPTIPKAKPVRSETASHESTANGVSSAAISSADKPISLQIVTGSYERILHGFTATLAPDAVATADPDATSGSATFSDTFLFSAHAASVRSLAISQPTQAGKRILATGSSDERVNLYQIASAAPSSNAADKLSSSSSLLGSSISENPRNRELGSLLHHSRTVTRLLFPTKSKLFSAAQDNTIAITRVRDWTMLSSIKAPVPMQHGRPSGDTAAPGEVPAGVNDFAIHPSMKLMISVGKGERCMRLWNLVTGKKAGVLNFDKSLLTQAGEGKFGTGEGRRVVWSQDGEKFVVIFERGAVVYNMDSEPVAVIKSAPMTKLHQAKFVPTGAEGAHILAVSTENGRIMFFDLARYSTLPDAIDVKANDKLPVCACVAQIESATLSSAGRIKDFELLEIPSSEKSFNLVFVTASSDGAVRLWGIDAASLDVQGEEGEKVASPKQVGTLLGVRETGNRLTCLTGFVMDDSVDDDKQEEVEVPVGNDSDSSDSDE